MEKVVLVTGGCGYIGRNMVKSLVKNGHEVIIVDSLINSVEEAVLDGTKFYKCDIRDKQNLNKIFEENSIDLVMDFAALLDVEESSRIPLEYLDVNVNGLKVILEVMTKHNVKNIVFSSTAAIYGDSPELLTEQSDINPINPYGQSKLSAEKFLEYYADVAGINYIIFRYFNVVGSSKFGVDWEEFSSVVPNILSSMKNEKTFKINGGDYDTIDGTPVRDYIHMDDLISAHQLVIDNFDEVESGVYNLSIGNGTSVLELYNAICEVFNYSGNYKITERRKGDIVCSVASNQKILKQINWQLKYKDIDEIVKKIREEN